MHIRITIEIGRRVAVALKGLCAAGRRLIACPIGKVLAGSRRGAVMSATVGAFAVFAREDLIENVRFNFIGAIFALLRGGEETEAFQTLAEMANGLLIESLVPATVVGFMVCWSFERLSHLTYLYRGALVAVGIVAAAELVKLIRRLELFFG